MDPLLRRGSRAGADARSHGHSARYGVGADQEDSRESPRPRKPRASPLADDRLEVTQGVDRAEGRRRPSERGHLSRPSGAPLGPENPSRTPPALGKLAAKLPAGGTLR